MRVEHRLDEKLVSVDRVFWVLSQVLLDFLEEKLWEQQQQLAKRW